MQFVKNGPHIPELLLQAHEEGCVVFFCGAGISYPADLPDFEGLVKQLYQHFRPTPNAVQRSALNSKQFDTAIGLLEADVMGGRVAVRHELVRILTPESTSVIETATHQALLTLSRTRSGATRLVTTNFDRLFEHVIKRDGVNIEHFRAPLLPVPKNRWDGLVYLHGLLTESPTDTDLQRLVVASGDYGLAYLTERWAARFVSELFTTYTVCFVGYSINDPVLRYMMDALAADRLLGEAPTEMFAFGGYSDGEESTIEDEWRAKNVTPILYNEQNNHQLLHKSLQEWAANYRDGVRGKERIVLEYSMARPLASTKQDDFIGRMLWALSDPTGLPAKRFAGHTDLDPTPSLDWLEPLCENNFRHADLSRFGVPPQNKQVDKLAFSLMHRPAPYTLAPWMMLVDAGSVESQLDDVMFHLARWLTRHLDDPALVWWLVKRGGHLHERFIWLVEQRLSDLARLENEGKVDDLERIRTNAPRAIPRPVMRTVWRMILTGRVKSGIRDFDIYRWQDSFKREGLTPSLRMELREMIAPRVSLRQPFRWGEDVEKAGEPERLRELIDWEIVLSTDHFHSSLNDLAKTPAWQTTLPLLLVDVQLLLNDALDLMRELGEADDLNDRAHWDLPSIEQHWQNRGFHEWVSLIEILRDAWLETLKHDPAKARHIVEDWLKQPYPTFKRLALFAATQGDIGSGGEWVEWLLADDGWWLWSVVTQREAMRLLVLRGNALPSNILLRLEKGILAGPPRRMFREDIEHQSWVDLVDHTVWLRVAKLQLGGAVLNSETKTRFEALTSAHPQWQLAKDQSDEFSHWMSGTGDPGYEDRHPFERVPRRRVELMAWLIRPQLPNQPIFENKNDWREVCRDKFATAACALCALAREDKWPVEHWREALQAWSDDKLLRRSWRYMAPILQRMPGDMLLTLAHSATWWLEAAAKVFDRHEAVFLDLCRQFLSMDHQDGMETGRPVTRAINHPVGHITQALLHFWFRQQPEDGQGLPEVLKPIFTVLCDTNVEKYRHARVLLAAHVIALFRVDRDWTTENLLPLFDWNRSAIEAQSAWEGFLWSPRLYLPLLVALKDDILETAHHYEQLGEHARQYSAVLTYAALDPADIFTIEELRAATAALPKNGLQEAAQTLVHALESSGEQREDYWTNRIEPYLRNIWPHSHLLATKAISGQFALLAIAARGAFPAALSTLHGWLQPTESPDFVVHRLHESRLCGQHSQSALTLLAAIIADQPWPPRELRDCLDDIANAWPEAQNDNRFQRLMEYVRRRGTV